MVVASEMLDALYRPQPTLRVPRAYRQSLIAAFDSCPRRALYSLLDGRRTPSGLAAGGTLNHRFFHRGTKIMIEHGESTMSVEQGMELYAEILAQRDVPAHEVVPVTMRQMRWGRVIVTKWCQTTKLDLRRIVDAEVRLTAELPLASGETVSITGQMDLLLADPPRGMIAGDYKTGFQRPKQPRADASDEDGRGLTELGWVQALVYSVLIFHNFPVVEYVIFRERHVLWGEDRTVRIDREEAERLHDVLAAQVALMDQAVREGIDSPRWTPSAGPHCALCARPHDCPIRDQVEMPASEAEARELAQEWIVTDARRKERVPFLKGWVEEHGPIEVPHARGRRVVGWDVAEDGKRNFGVFEPTEIAESPFDDLLERAARDAGVLTDA